MSSNRSSQNAPHKHHYIPIFYSKQWAGADGRLVCFTKPYRQLEDRRKHPAAIGWKDNLYAVSGESDRTAQWLETDFFARLDNLAANILRNLLSQRIRHLSEYDVGHWSMFIRSLLHRSPTAYEEFQQTGLKHWRKALRSVADTYADVRQSHEPPTYAEFLERQSDDVGRGKVAMIMPGILASQRVLSTFAQAPWVRFDVPQNCPDLLLSDAPIVRTNGFLIEGGHLAMPLSPRRFLLIARDKPTAKYIEGLPIKTVVKSINLGIVSQARHFVAATDMRQAHFIEKHFRQ